MIGSKGVKSASHSLLLGNIKYNHFASFTQYTSATVKNKQKLTNHSVFCPNFKWDETGISTESRLKESERESFLLLLFWMTVGAFFFDDDHVSHH